MKKTQRWLCLLLVLCMLLSVLPVTAMAAEPDAEPSVQAAGTVLYQEDFDTALPTGLDAASWERVELQSGGYALQGTSPAKAGLLAELPLEALPDQYTIVADVALVRAVASGEGYSAGVTFQQTDAQHYYHFRLDHPYSGFYAQLYQWTTNAAGSTVVNKTIASASETGTELENAKDGVAYRLRVTVSADTINCYVDGKLVATYANGAAGGKLGLRIYNAVALLDNLTVYSGVVAPEAGERAADLTLAGTTPETKEPEIFVNQIGYDNGTSMRATIPNVADGTEFKVVNKATGETAYTGTVVGGIADFTGQITTSADTTFYITCADKQQSYDFEIGTNLIQRRSVKNALAFMTETRSDVDIVGSNSIAWRDSHQFSFELNGLVLQYMANPSVYDNMPHTVFAKMPNCEYEDLRTQKEPDIIWLIKFAARRYYDWGCTEGKKLHMLTKEQLAYYLYLAPELIARGWETQDFYQKVRDYTISVWGENACNVSWYAVSGTNHDLYSVQTVFGGLKGSQPMGHSIVPNLMMYEVAKRDGLDDAVAEKFLTAAVDNCAYTVSNTDGNDICDPFFCKGQRMSEYVTIPALDYFVEMCPGQDALKAQVKAKIAQWATVNIARGDNLWDIRMAVSAKAGDLTNYQFHNPNFTDKTIQQEYWTGAAYANADNQAQYFEGGAPKNEPGNQAGLQAVMYAAARVLKDDAATSNRLHALGVAAIDDLFGRNPTGTSAFYDVVRDFAGGDKGWYKQYQGGAGVLAGRTAVIEGNAPEFCYQNGYNPSKDYQNNESLSYTEGWVAYNTAWNASLAYSQAETVALSVDTANGTKVGDTVTVTLTAPIDMDTAAVEYGTVQMTNNTTGERTDVTVTESGASSTIFTGSFALPNAESITVSYGSGLFAHTQTITVANYQPVKTTALKLKADKTEANVGETVKLTVTFEPENATDKTVDFTSDNTDVATVDANGNVTLLAKGEATITVALHSNPAITSDVTLTVKEATQSSYEFDLLGLFQKGKYSYTGDADKAPKEITDNSVEVPGYGYQRVSLKSGAGRTIAFQLGTVAAGTYKVTLHTKYYETYGKWNLKLNDQSFGTFNFNDTKKNGGYHDLELGTVTLTGGETTFTFVSESEGGLVPVYVKLERTDSEPQSKHYLILADSYDRLGSWELVNDDTAKDAWNGSRLRGKIDKADHSNTPAVATIDNVTAGTYYLWVNSKQFTSSQTPESRFFYVSVNGTKIAQKFGTTPRSAAGYAWEGPIEVTLTDGTNTIRALDGSGWYANLNGILLTQDAALNPAEKTTAEIEEMSIHKTVTPSTDDPVDPMDDVTIDFDFAGGGVKFISKQDGVVTLTPDLSDFGGSYPWFYWNIKVKSETARTITFQFQWGSSIGDGGVLYSTDNDQTWHYLQNNSHDRFQFTFEAGQTVHFSCALPYQLADLNNWLDELQQNNNGLVSVNRNFSVTDKVLKTTGKTEPIPMITLGNPDAPKYLIFTGRMHACETIASFTLEGVVNDFASLPADDPFWDEYCIYVVPMMDIAGVENGDQGKDRLPHDHNRDWEDGKELYKVTLALKEFARAKEADGKRLAMFIDYHCPYLFNWAGNYISYGEWNEPEVELFADILEKTVKADTRPNRIRFNFMDEHSYGRNIQETQQPNVSKTWFYNLNKDVIATFSIETLFTEKNNLYVPENLHQWGGNIATTIREFLKVAGKNSEAELKSFKLNGASGTITESTVLGELDFYNNSTTSIKDWYELGQLTLDANETVKLDFTAIGQTEGAKGKFRLAAEKIRLTNLADGTTQEFAAKDVFTKNGNASQSFVRSEDGLWLTQNIDANGNGTNDKTGCSVLISVTAPKSGTYKLEIYGWKNQDGGIYRLTDPRGAVSVTLPEGTNLTALTPEVTVSDGATYTPAGAQDFTGPVYYTVTAENERAQKRYLVNVKLEGQSSNLEYGFLGLYLDNKYQYTAPATGTSDAPEQIEDHTDSLPTYGKNRVKLYDGTVTFDLGNVPTGRYNVTLFAKHYSRDDEFGPYGTWTLKLNDTVLGTINYNDDLGGRYHADLLGTVELTGGNTTFTFVSDGTGPVVPVYVKFEPAAEVNKAALKAAIALAEGKAEADYCAESWKAMQTALAAATAVNANVNATQEQVNTATANLNAALTALQAHTWSTAWSSDANEHWHECSNCHAKKDEDAHNWDNGKVTSVATCTTVGVKTYTCSKCGATKTETIGATGHTLTQHPAKAPTETAEGNIEYWECSNCGKKFKNEACTEEVTDVTIPKLTPAPAPAPVTPVTPSEPASDPFNPNAGANTAKFPFTDVPSNSWYYSSVKAAWENDLIDGVTANEFKPNATLTVAQTIKLAAALHQLGRTGEVSLKNGGANWYDSYVNYAVTNGIIEQDYAAYTKAQMNAPVTRGEFVHIFHGAEEAYKAINTVADNAIPDVKTTDKFAPEIYEFYRAGILTGSDAKGTFHSASTIKRSEAAAILLRMFEASARKTITLK